MFRIGWKMIWGERGRLAITLAGIGVTVLLMLFLVGVYRAVQRGATSYLSHTGADFWICRNNSTNLLRNASFLPETVLDDITATGDAESATGILRTMAAATIRQEVVTLVIIGFDPSSPLGQPKTLLAGTAGLREGEIVLDDAFCRKYALALGDTLAINGRTFTVTAICTESNAIVAQFAFVTLRDAQLLLGLPETVSFILVKGRSGVHPDSLRLHLSRAWPALTVFSAQDFTDNTVRDLQKGLLPVLWVIALFGLAVGAIVTTLMLYGAVLERREDFALLKALGASHRQVSMLVLLQSLCGSIAGTVLGSILTVGVTPLLVRVVPELILSFSFASWTGVGVASVAFGLAGAWIPLRKLRRVYPAEVFRA